MNLALNSSRPEICMPKIKLWRSPPHKRGSMIIKEVGV